MNRVVHLDPFFNRLTDKWAQEERGRRAKYERDRWERINRECARRHIGHAFDEAEAALDFLGTLKRAGHPITFELEECEVTLKAFLVQVMALRGFQQGE